MSLQTHHRSQLTSVGSIEQHAILSQSAREQRHFSRSARIGLWSGARVRVDTAPTTVVRSFNGDERSGSLVKFLVRLRYAI